MKRLCVTSSRLITLALVLAIGLSLLFTSATERVRAAPFTVTNLDDSGAGSLRQAILDANTTPEEDTITFAPGLTGTIVLTTGQLVIFRNLIIQGPGAPSLTISGNNASRVFFITSGGSLTISDLTISNAYVSGVGGGILNNFGTLTLTNSTLSGNSATDAGGGISNNGTATITNSTLSNNTTFSTGGGIRNLGTLTITNSTLSGNSSAQGGGICNTVGTAKISNSTLSNNSSGLGGGVFVVGGTTVTIKNSIVANSTSGGNCAGAALNSEGKNLTTDNTCTGTGFTQVTTAELNLGPLELNAPGTTPTRALLPGSAAIDAVTDCTDIDLNLVITDQRGVSRPQGAACDVGAFEATPEGMIENLIEIIEGFDPPLHHGTANSLLAKLDNALAELAAGDTAEARALIGAFINEVEAQAGKKISQAQAAELIAAANAILVALE